MGRYIANLCLMADFGISKKKVCLMANSSTNIDEVNELDPQMTFEKLYHDYKKLYKKKICFKINLILFQKILMYYKKRMMSY
jgi:hypothetical protein